MRKPPKRSVPFAEVQELLENVLITLKTNPDCFRYTPHRDKTLTCFNLDAAAGNHLFDDHHDDFGITDWEGHRLREYFQTSASEGYLHISELQEAFPQIMEPEEAWYLAMANGCRARLGLEPLNGPG